MVEGSSNNRVLCGGKWITVQDIEEQYGKPRKDAAATFNVSVSTFRRACKKVGINRWPYPKRESSRIHDASTGKSVLDSSSQSSSKNKLASTKESCNSSEKPSQLPQMEETSSQNNDIRIRQAEAVVGSIQGNNTPNSVIEPSLQSISTDQPFSSIENIQALFKHLIALPLEDLSHPEKETSMKNALSILVDNLTLFSKEEADQILVLLFDFPALVHNWRECYSRSQTYNLKPVDETEKIRDLVESLKVRYEQLEKKEKELMTQLAAVQKEKAEIAQQRIEKSKQTKELMEKEAHRNKEERLTRIATTKLNNLSDQWAKLRSSFI